MSLEVFFLVILGLVTYKTCFNLLLFPNFAAQKHINPQIRNL